MSRRQISRRTVLQGLGTALALPWLEGMSSDLIAAPATTTGKPPLRVAFLYVPNGAHMPDWTPEAEGRDFTLPAILEPLAPFQKQLNVLTGLSQKKANANGDGPGDHARALATFLTGTQARKTSGADIRAGISIDQLLAQKIGQYTRFPSLELGCEQGQQAGNCDSGYSCAYSSNIAWKTESQPVAKEVNPRAVFERLFTNGRPNETAEARAKRERYNKSILDFVREDAGQLRNRLGAVDQRKLDEYLTAVREVEQRIARFQQESPDSTSDIARLKPAGIPKNYDEHLKVMADLLALSFQTDVTRISTFVFANEGSNRSYGFLDVPEGHHSLSHHGKDAKKQAKIRKINLFHVGVLAHLLTKLQSVQEGDGTLLDHSLILYGSGIGDGDRHNHDNLPILLAGGARGLFPTGRHLKFDNGTPLTNLFVTLLDLIGHKVPSFGDSTGPLSLA